MTSPPNEVCLPLGRGRALWTHKSLTPLDGTLTLDKQRITFERATSYALADIHKGFYPYITKWNWATGGGRDEQGHLIGFNLTNNQVRDPERYNENCLWMNGRLSLLPPVTFSYDERDLHAPWTIRSQDGQVDLTFRAEAIRTVNLWALVIRSRYRGPFGAFNGTLKDESGASVAIKDLYGMCEDFYLRV
jgi:hypothetical protein